MTASYPIKYGLSISTTNIPTLLQKYESQQASAVAIFVRSSMGSNTGKSYPATTSNRDIDGWFREACYDQGRLTIV